MDKASSALRSATFGLGTAMVGTIFEITLVVSFAQDDQPPEGLIIFVLITSFILCFLICGWFLSGIRSAIEYIDRSRNPDRFEPEPDEELDEATAAMQKAGLLITDDDEVIRHPQNDELCLRLDNGYVGALTLLLSKIDHEWHLFSPSGSWVPVEQGQCLKARLYEFEASLRGDLESTAS